MKTRRANAGRGFTLIEVMICVVMLGIIFTASMAFVSSAWRSTNFSQDKIFAVQKAISILSEIRSFLETPVEDTDAEGNPIVRDKTIFDLDALDNGTGTDPILTIFEDIEQIDRDGDGEADPDHPRSGNIRAGDTRHDSISGGDAPWWKYERQVTVRPLYEQGIIVRRDVRLVLAKVFAYRENGSRVCLAEVGTVLRTTADAFPTTQVYDVYCVALDTVPGWWVFMSYIKPFVETCLKDLENRNPGLDIREHWITKSGYGRDPEYTPFFNLATNTIDPVDRVYWYLGSLLDCDVDKYYSPDRVAARINVDEELKNDYDAASNPYPYAAADQWNHCHRFIEATEYRDKRHDFREANKLPLLDEAEPPYQLWLDDMIINPAKYLNAIIVNLHGELMPLAPVRNYSDAAKDPVNHPGWRVVTHPEKIWNNNTDPALDAADPMSWKNADSPEAYVNFRVYAYVHPGQDSDAGGATYPMASTSGIGVRNPNRQGYYTSGSSQHPNTIGPTEGIEYMAGNYPNATNPNGGSNVDNANVPITLSFELLNDQGVFTQIDLMDRSLFPADCPPVRVWRVEGGFDLVEMDARRTVINQAPDTVQDDYVITECPIYPEGITGRYDPDKVQHQPDYNGQMYCRFAPPTDEAGKPADPLDAMYASHLKPNRTQFGESREASVLELFNTPMYTPQCCVENEGPAVCSGLLNSVSNDGLRYHLYQMEYIPCSTDDRPDITTPITSSASNHPYYLSLHQPSSLRTGYERCLAWTGPDIVAGDMTSANYIYNNEGGATHWTRSWRAWNGSSETETDTWDIKFAQLTDDNGDTVIDSRDLPDLVVANNGVNYAYINTGDGGKTWTPYQITSDANNSYGIATGDFDRDGDLDVVVANYAGYPRFYRNGGGGTSWTRVNILASNLNARAIAVGDIDGDTDLDVVVGIASGTNKVFLNGNPTTPTDPDNLGTGAEWAAAIDLTADADDTFSVAIADMDNDGDNDVIVGNSGQADKVYWNQGAGVFINTAVSLIGTNEYTRDIAVGHFNDDNGDGILGLNTVTGDSDLLDVVCARGNPTGGTEEQKISQVYLQQAATINPTTPTTPPSFVAIASLDTGAAENGYTVAVGDLDVDGDMDIAIGYSGQQNKVYLNNGTGTTWTMYPITTDAFSTRGIDISPTLGGVTQEPKNTARWIIQIPKMFLAGAGATPRTGALRVTTRIGRDLTTGVFWPKAPDTANDVTGRNDPANVSRTATWFTDDPARVPFSERYQFLGDPRHCPYVDLRHNGNPPPADYTPFADGYNWYFTDFRDTEGADARGLWGNGLDRNRLVNGWHPDNRCEFDVPRFFYWFRSAIIESRCVFTTLTGFSFYYMCMGNEVGYDSANGDSFTDGVPLTSKIFDGTTGTTTERQMDQESGHYGTKLIGADFSEGSVKWWTKPWIGELYPDYLYATNWRWPEDGEDDLASLHGNLPTGTGAGTFRWIQRSLACRDASSFSDTSRPYGTSFRDYGAGYYNSIRRTQTRGCTSMFNSLAASGKAFCHRFKDYGSLGALQTVGQQLATRYQFPVPTQTSISRPFTLGETSTFPNEWDLYPYNERNITQIPAEMGFTQIFYNHTSDPANLIGSAIVRVRAPAIDKDVPADGITDDLQKCGYVVVNGLDKTTETGTAFIAKYSVLSLIHTFLACGHPNLTDPALPIDYRITQLPRVQVLEPSISTELDDPTDVTVRWKSEWFRWDGQTYTDEFAAGFAEEESMLKYVLMYSKDGGETWQYMDDNSNVLFPDGPGLGKHDITNPVCMPHQLDDAGVGEEIWTWNTANKLTFPEGTYVVRVECYRQGCPLHYAHHMEKIFIRR